MRNKYGDTYTFPIKQIGSHAVGDGQPCYIVAEIGINHNGDLSNVRRLIEAASKAGVDAVKFQKRTVEDCYTLEELAKPRQSPFGTTNGDLKYGLELDYGDYASIDRMCREHCLDWFASCWDRQAVDDIEAFNPPCYKIASACLTDHDLVSYTCSMKRPIILSTGMSSVEEINAAVNLIAKHGNPLVLLHCTSTYPSESEELNLRAIPFLRKKFHVPCGYSGHELGLATTVAAVAMGACMVERHLTLDRAMFGSDQAASIEPHALYRLVRDIREVEKALGDGIKRVYESELPIRAKLRKTGVTS